MYPNAPLIPEPPIGYGRDFTKRDEERGIENAVSGNDDSDAASLAWWYGLDNVSRYKGIENSLSFLANYIHGQPIHGVIGFSQGACLAAMVCSLLECIDNSERAAAIRAQNLPVDDYLGLPGQKPLRFLIEMGGYCGTAQFYGSLYLGKLNTPSCHTLASLDIMVDNFWTLDLARRFTSYEIVHYFGYHYVPRGHATVEALARFVLMNSFEEHSDKWKASEIDETRSLVSDSRQSMRGSRIHGRLRKARVITRRQGILWEVYLR